MHAFDWARPEQTLKIYIQFSSYFACNNDLCSATVIIFGRLEMPPRSPSAKRVQAFDGRKSCIFQGLIWQKAEEYMPKLVCQHSTAQVIVTGNIRRVLYVNFECLFWPIKIYIQNQDFGYTLAMFLLLKSLFYS